MGLFHRISLQYQIAAGVLLGVAILLSLFGWLAVQTIRQTRDLALEGRLDTANASAHAIDAIVLHEAEELERAASEIGAQSSPASEQELARKMYNVLELFHVLVRLDENGRFLWSVPAGKSSSWDMDAGLDISDALVEGETTIIRPQVSDGDIPLFAMIVTPVKDKAGSSSGFLAGELDASQDHPELIPLATLTEGTTAFLIDDRGNVIAQGAGPPLTSEDWDATTIAELIDGRQAGTAIDRKHGDSHVEAYHPLTTLPAGVVVEEKNDRALAIPRTLERNMLWVGIGGVVVAVAAAWFHSRGVVGPLRELTAASARIAAGSLDEPIQVTREDEVGQLAHSFETMRRRLKESLEERRRWEEQLEARVRQRTQEVQSLLGKVISAQEEERMRIARDLHDESGQDLVALLAGVRTAEAALPSSPAKAKQILEGLRPLAKQALEEMRKNILKLRPSALDDFGLAPAIRWYAESRLSPLGVTLYWEESGGGEKLPEPTAIALYRIAQEAINNVVKHAQASEARIGVRFTDSDVAIDIVDNGEGFALEQLHPSGTDTRGLGIMGMRERASLVGGTVEIDSAPGRGTTVSIRVPLHQGGTGFGEDPPAASG